MSAITTHVLDTAAGSPAPGIPVALEIRTEQGWRRLGSGVTDAGGRLHTLLTAEAPLEPGAYRLTFDLSGRPGFFPEVAITFEVRDPKQHYHVPLLLSPYGYTTYRGS